MIRAVMMKCVGKVIIDVIALELDVKYESLLLNVCRTDVCCY